MLTPHVWRTVVSAFGTLRFVCLISATSNNRIVLKILSHCLNSILVKLFIILAPKII